MIASDRTEAYRVGVEYINKVRALVPDPHMVDVMSNLRDRVSICNWIGHQIKTVNNSLQTHLNTCHECFNLSDRRAMQILAVPFAASVSLDGFCNINTNPTTILVDVGRVAPPDRLALVAHEYAHAYLGYPGHDLEYVKVLSHLCLGLGLAQPSFTPDDRSIYYWPPYSPTIDPLAWWRGESDVG
ncbi:hypothetical protein [Chamaesiphon minutus]|uniref:Uncharacterized protein n=1 Tax=Chamaesiphon minutus (strain ATCC 27169 / PCC 6605) TaxID=1173020 RepID=K9UE85_CHAP6|nr:hypothetical protein Cha6605_1320 [Chamaesiphon minutus PCC 6605]